MHVGHTYILLLRLYILAYIILQADQCTSTEQVRNKLQAQLESAKAELEAWQNETVQLLQCTGKDTALAALKKNRITVYKCVNFHLMHGSLHHTATAAGCVTPEELTQITDSLLQEVKQSHRELKAEIKELKNMTAG